MCQFGYMKVVQRAPFVSSPPTMPPRYVDAMYEDFLNRLVRTEVRGVVSPIKWSCAFRLSNGISECHIFT